jgi:hypothetical protein
MAGQAGLLIEQLSLTEGHWFLGRQSPEIGLVFGPFQSQLSLPQDGLPNRLKRAGGLAKGIIDESISGMIQNFECHGDGGGSA